MGYISIILNIGLRLAIIYFLGEVMLFSEDLRFAGKAIPLRNLIIVGSLSLLFPLLYLLRKKRGSYPFFLDSLYLSIFALDMAGNSFNFYDSYSHFDLIPHFHGTGALTTIILLVTFARENIGKIKLSWFEKGALAAGIATIIHMALEAQEYYTDVLAGTHNVRGVFDTINDFSVGLLGSLVYIGIVFAIFKLGSPQIHKKIIQPLIGLLT